VASLWSTCMQVRAVWWSQVGIGVQIEAAW
jgi:hypothetical protein